MAHHYPNPQPLLRYTLGRLALKAIDHAAYALPAGVLALAYVLTQVGAK